MSMIEMIYQAVVSGQLPATFSTKDIKQWVVTNNIKKPDGSDYASSSITSIGANSNLKNRPTSNKNNKVLKSTKVDKKTLYYFSEGD